MYQIVSTLNRLIREEVMSNPFEFISDNQIVVILFFSLFGGRLLYKCTSTYKTKSVVS